MDDKTQLECLLTINYNKLLAYLAGAVVSIFSLFQIATEATVLPYWLVYATSTAALAGVVIFVFAGYFNWDEIIRLENQLGLSKVMTVSYVFSMKRRGGVRRVSPLIKAGCCGFLFVSVLMWSYCIAAVA